MRAREEFPLDPEIVTRLEVIDATLAGDPVDPRHADLAELALLLAADKPVIEEGFARLLDQHVRDRRRPSSAAVTGRPQAVKRPRRRQRGRWWVWAPASAVAASLVAAVVIVAEENKGGAPSFGASSAATTASGAPVRRTFNVAPGGGQKLALQKAKPAPRQLLAGISHHHSAGNGPVSTASSSAGGGSAGGAAPGGNFGTSAQPPTVVAPSLYGTLQQAPTLQPPTQGRKVIQGAQLSLMTRPQRVDQVSQEVYNVIGQENGIVKSSSVTANGGHGGYAQFQLSVPSSNLARTMSSLSTLPYAHVVSRTDNTQDVTNTYRVDQQRLNDARALHTSLLKQLANAVTQAQIDSIQARIRDDEGAIAADQSSLDSLQRSISYSQVNLQINSGSIPVPLHHSSSGFTLSKAVHDAGRVLTVAAGVILIVLAGLVPVTLLLALFWWVLRTARRRSRLQALDLA